MYIVWVLDFFLPIREVRVEVQAVADDSVQQAVVKTNAPDELRNEVEMNACPSFEVLKGLFGWVTQKLGRDEPTTRKKQ